MGTIYSDRYHRTFRLSNNFVLTLPLHSLFDHYPPAANTKIAVNNEANVGTEEVLSETGLVVF